LNAIDLEIKIDKRLVNNNITKIEEDEYYIENLYRYHKWSYI